MENSAQGRLADNILLFCRSLRAVGIEIGSSQVLDALTAVVKVGVHSRADLCYALRTVLIHDPAHFALFEQTFYFYFRNPRLLERMVAMMLPTLERVDDKSSQGQISRRLLESLAQASNEPHDELVYEIDQAESYSHSEILRQKDFEQMSLEELTGVRQLLAAEMPVFRKITNRRFKTSTRGNQFDHRASLRQMLRNNGELGKLSRMRRQQSNPTIVLLCDISGSMSQYSRAFLQFAHLLSSRQSKVSCFLFGTRLTNVSRYLNDRDVDQFLGQVGKVVQDWDGGTRIADCLRAFNQDWGRRVIAGNAVVVLLTDGLDQDPDSDLEFQMQRLKGSSRRLIWMNPLLRFSEFEPKAQGIRCMIPHVDAFVPAHNVESLLGLGQAVMAV